MALKKLHEGIGRSEDRREFTLEIWDFLSRAGMNENHLFDRPHNVTSGEGDLPILITIMPDEIHRQRMKAARSERGKRGLKLIIIPFAISDRGKPSQRDAPQFSRRHMGKAIDKMQTEAGDRLIQILCVASLDVV